MVAIVCRVAADAGGVFAGVTVRDAARVAAQVPKAAHVAGVWAGDGPIVARDGQDLKVFVAVDLLAFHKDREHVGAGRVDPALLVIAVDGG